VRSYLLFPNPRHNPIYERPRPDDRTNATPDHAIEMIQADKALSRGTTRVAMRWVMAVFYFAAGIVHLAAPERFLPIVPDFVPVPHAVVLVTGFCEIAGSVALLTKRLRRLAGVMLAIYAVCVFPATSSMRLRAFTCRCSPTAGGIMDRA
jgi:uncharacterized membrane protein